MHAIFHPFILFSMIPAEFHAEMLAKSALSYSANFCPCHANFLISDKNVRSFLSPLNPHTLIYFRP